MKSTRCVVGIDKPISELALGTAWYSLQNRYRLFELMDDFVSYGGTTLDTARGYGESEKVIGLWMDARRNRNRMVIITKGGLSEQDGGRLAIEGFKEKVEKDITTSLDYLQTDYIDLYFLHRDTPSIPVAEIVDCLNAELDRGRIHAFGGSNWKTHRVDDANEYAEGHGLTGFTAVSNNLSLAVPTGPFYPGLVSTDKVGEHWHAKTRIPLFSWSSQARGFFTGRYGPDMKAAHGVRNAFHKNLIRVYCTKENFERLNRAKELGEKKDVHSAVQIALAWVLHKSFIIFPLVGPHTREELRSCIDALSIELTESEIKWLNLEDNSVNPVTVQMDIR